MSAVSLYNRTKDAVRRLMRRKISLVAVTVAAAIALLYFVVVLPAIHHLERSKLPDLPDFAGQSKPVIEYIYRMNNEAREYPASDEAVGRLGMAYHAHLFYDNARASYRRAIELNPAEWRWRYYLALLNEDLGNAKEAIDDLRAVIERNPGAAQAWFRLGNAYIKTRSYEEAGKAFQQALRLEEAVRVGRSAIGVPVDRGYPLTTYAKLQAARVQFLQKHYLDAKASLTDLVATSPSFGPAYRLLGSVYYELGDEGKTAECEVRADDFDSYVPPGDAMYEALVLCSRNTDFISKEIDHAVKRRDYGWTVTLIDHILDYNPNDGEALTRRLKLVLDRDQGDEIQTLVTEYFERFGTDEMKLLDMAIYLRYRGQYESSTVFLKRVTSLNPKSTDAHKEYVGILKAFKQYDTGIKYCTEVINNDPNNFDMRVELANLLILDGKTNSAVDQLRIVKKLHPDREILWLMLGRLAKRTGEVQSALRYYRNSLTVNPGNVTTQLELGTYLIELRRWDEAARQFQASLHASPNNIELMEQFAWILATCPDGRIRNGNMALELAHRLALVKKRTFEQDIRCGIALAAAHAETGQFGRAIEVATTYVGKTKAHKQKDFTRKLESMIQLFESSRPYRL